MTFKRFDEYVHSILKKDRAASGKGTIQSFDAIDKKPDIQ